jgi:hypothetical protein
MADQKPKKLPATKTEPGNVGQKFGGEEDEKPAEFKAGMEPEFKKIERPGFKAEGGSQEETRARDIEKEKTRKAEAEAAAERAEIRAGGGAKEEEEEEEEEAQPETEQPEERKREKEQQFLTGAGAEQNAKEEMRNELLKQRAIAAAKESTGEEGSEEEDKEKAKEKTKSLAAQEAQRMVDRGLDFFMIGIMAPKDAVNVAMAIVLNLDFGLFASFAGIVCAINANGIRKFQKTRKNKMFNGIFIAILICAGLPIFSLIPTSLALFYFFRAEDAYTQSQARLAKAGANVLPK